MRTRYMLQASAIAVGQVALLGSIAIGQIVRFERSGAAGYTPDFLDTFVEVLWWPVFLVVRPQSTFWLRPYLGDDRWIIVVLLGINAALWGAALTGLIYCWRRSLARQRLLATAMVVALLCLASILTLTGAVYCHRGFAGAVHCHSFRTAEHDH